MRCKLWTKWASLQSWHHFISNSFSFSQKNLEDKRFFFIFGSDQWLQKKQPTPAPTATTLTTLTTTTTPPQRQTLNLLLLDLGSNCRSQKCCQRRKIFDLIEALRKSFIFGNFKICKMIKQSNLNYSGLLFEFTPLLEKGPEAHLFRVG